MWPFISAFFYLACFQGSCTWWHVSVCHYFLWLNNIPQDVYTTVCLSIHLLMDMWIVFFVFVFVFFAAVNNVSMNIHVQVFLWVHVFNSLEYIHRSRIAGSSVFNFLRKHQTVCHSSCHIYILSSVQGLQNLPIHANTYYFVFFPVVAILVDVKWYFIVGLIWISLMINDVVHLFMCSLTILCIVFGE